MTKHGVLFLVLWIINFLFQIKTVNNEDYMVAEIAEKL